VCGHQGKTTLLRILGGKHLHDRDAVKVMGRSAFYDTVGWCGGWNSPVFAPVLLFGPVFL
jgi:hypothetical protein